MSGRPLYSSAMMQPTASMSSACSARVRRAVLRSELELESSRTQRCTPSTLLENSSSNALFSRLASLCARSAAASSSPRGRAYVPSRQVPNSTENTYSLFCACRLPTELRQRSSWLRLMWPANRSLDSDTSAGGLTSDLRELRLSLGVAPVMLVGLLLWALALPPSLTFALLLSLLSS